MIGQQTPIETPMDEFEVKTQASHTYTDTKQKTKSSFVKTILLLIGILVGIGATGVIVMMAVQNTGQSQVQGTPTPLPVVIQPSGTPIPQVDLPPEWQQTEGSITSLQRELNQENDERGKISVPTINFETTLTE